MADFRDDASRIVNTILEQQRPEVDKNLYIDDLILQTDEFWIDYRTLMHNGFLFPCIRRQDGTVAPIALPPPLIATDDWRGSGPPRFARHFFEEGRSVAEEAGIVFVDPREARDNFKSGMVRFLSSRMRSLFDSDIVRVSLRLPKGSFFGMGAATVSTPGFRVDVSASPNIRVHVSPTFRRSWRLFASPTSPASGMLPGGIYEFGVDGGPYPTITPDAGTFDIPYTTVTPALAL
jgi:hypothetical protein